MNKTKKVWIERGKNVLIVALTCSAAVLLLTTRQYSAPGQQTGGWMHSLYQTLTGTAGSTGEDTVLLTETVRPVRMAVTTAQGRYGVQYDDEKLDELFEAVSPLLTESMASYDRAQPGTIADWNAAMAGYGVYFDFLGNVPLDALAVRSDSRGSVPQARRIILSLREKTAQLWYWNETDDTPYTCTLTETLWEQLRELMTPYDKDDGSSFAFEREEYELLSPWQLLTMQTYTLPTYQVSDPLSGNQEHVERLVQTVGFNTHALYSVNGEWVAKDGADTLRIRSDGTVTYTSDEQSGTLRLPISVSGTRPTPAEAIEGARKLVERTLGQLQSEARFYLISCTETAEGGLEVQFGYLLNGAEVRLSSGSSCARVVVSGHRISEFTLHYRSYTATETTSAVLPLEQAVAAMTANVPEGGELLLCYPDGGGERELQAAWAVRSK